MIGNILKNARYQSQEPHGQKIGHSKGITPSALNMIPMFYK